MGLYFDAVRLHCQEMDSAVVRICRKRDSIGPDTWHADPMRPLPDNHRNPVVTALCCQPINGWLWL